MSLDVKPRFHEEECLGLSESRENSANGVGFNTVEASRICEIEALIESATSHFSNDDPESAVNDIARAYAHLARRASLLEALRNTIFRELSTQGGWHAPPHPQALRLRRLTSAA